MLVLIGVDSGFFDFFVLICLHQYPSANREWERRFPDAPTVNSRYHARDSTRSNTSSVVLSSFAVLPSRRFM